MSKADIGSAAILANIRRMVEVVPYRCHFKIHRMHRLKVPLSWSIEDNRRNEDLHLLYVIGGRGTYWLDGHEEPLRAGKLIFVSNGFAHSAELDPADPPVIIPIRFGLYEHGAARLHKLYEAPFAFACVPEPRSAYRQRFERLYEDYARADMEGLEQLCSAGIHAILIHLLNWRLNQKADRMDPRVIGMKQALDRSPERRTSLREWAERTGLSSKQVSRLFVQYFGMTPKQYHIRTLIKHAQFLLEETALTVSEIAEQLGYPDPYSFSKQYKQVTGVSPAAHRRATDPAPKSADAAPRPPL
ncbi:helix-turn-helix transcriptional regulator [Paenibacillus sp. IB182496]|uniref:Helix-turn-helix transcriptional regulator n=1 Tax=Paenibacillus sabuli TaxID=2772509 RepID=A0A927GR43_9BACL|nr:helix-turn-helix domain-containing protein [Paenibacillus sabuli]MBD2845058.1 helix-turn-helix transcriptional regulator [Paenibacillus sabuli]